MAEPTDVREFLRALVSVQSLRAWCDARKIETRRVRASWTFTSDDGGAALTFAVMLNVVRANDAETVHMVSFVVDGDAWVAVYDVTGRFRQLVWNG